MLALLVWEPRDGQEAEPQYAVGAGARCGRYLALDCGHGCWASHATYGPATTPGGRCHRRHHRLSEAPPTAVAPACCTLHATRRAICCGKHSLWYGANVSTSAWRSPCRLRSRARCSRCCARSSRTSQRYMCVLPKVLSSVCGWAVWRVAGAHRWCQTETRLATVTATWRVVLTLIPCCLATMIAERRWVLTPGSRRWQQGIARVQRRVRLGLG